MKFFQQHWLTVILCIFVVFLPWQTRFIFGAVPLAEGVTDYGVLSVYLSEIFLAVSLFIGYSITGGPKIRPANRRPLFLACVLLAFVLLVSMFSLEQAVSLFAFLHLFTAMLFFMALLDERVKLLAITSAFVIGLLPPMFLGLWQVVTGGSSASTVFGLALRDAEHLGDSVTIISGDRVLRAYGSFSHPNIFGGYLAVAICSVVWLVRVAPSPCLPAGRASERVGVRRGVGALLALALVLTASRSAILGLLLAAGLSVMVLKMKNTALARKLMVPIAAVVIGGAVLLTVIAPTQVAALRGGGRLEIMSLDERVTQYQEYPSVLSAEDAVIGSGLGTYVYALAAAHPGEEAISYKPIHNVPLLILEEIGLFGVILIGFWASSIDTMNYARFPNKDAVAAFAMGNVILVILFFDHYLWTTWSGLALIAFVMALTVRMGEKNQL